MYLILRFGNHGEIPLFITDNQFSKELAEHLPVKSKAVLWKEEYYFETPIEFRGRERLQVNAGDVAYWRPGKALCLFYGLSQPYSPVSIVGEIIGPLYLLKEVEDEEVEVLLEGEKSEGDGLVEKLRSEGFKAVRRKWQGYPSIALTARLPGNAERRIGFDIYEEDFGYSIETDGITKYDECSGQATLYAMKAVKNDLREKFNFRELEAIRVDINEDNYVCLSSFTEEKDKLPTLLKIMASLYAYLLDYLVGFSL